MYYGAGFRVRPSRSREGITRMPSANKVESVGRWLRISNTVATTRTAPLPNLFCRNKPMSRRYPAASISQGPFLMSKDIFIRVRDLENGFQFPGHLISESIFNLTYQLVVWKIRDLPERIFSENIHFIIPVNCHFQVGTILRWTLTSTFFYFPK